MHIKLNYYIQFFFENVFLSTLLHFFFKLNFGYAGTQNYTNPEQILTSNLIVFVDKNCIKWGDRLADLVTVDQTGRGGDSKQGKAQWGLMANRDLQAEVFTVHLRRCRRPRNWLLRVFSPVRSVSENKLYPTWKTWTLGPRRPTFNLVYPGTDFLGLSGPQFGLLPH